MESSDSPYPGAGGTGRPKWYLLYYLLAALDVVTVLASLTLNHGLVQIYVDSVAVRQQWAERYTQYARLAELARAVNAPGNDVFDSRDVRAESAQMRLALSGFNAQFDDSRDEVQGKLTGAEASLLLKAFAEIQQAMREMVAEAELIFSYFDSGKADLAGERMATMDRKYANVGRALERLFGGVRAIEHAHLEEQLRAAGRLKRVEHLIMGLAILMIAGALFYGARIYRASHAANKERLQYIEALTRTRAEADAANQAKSRFVAIVSHEIRTPLNTMLLTLDMLEHPPESTQERQTCLAVAHASGRSLKRLIDDLLDFSKIESGNVELECVRFDLSTLLRQLLAPYLHRAALKGVSFALRVAPEVPPAVAGDPTRFGQIIINLVDNAVKFTAAGSVEVSVSLRAELPHGGAGARSDTVPLSVAVRDTGIGVPSAQQARIFEDFVQADESTMRKYGGTGLGLGIVRRLVRLMDGEFGLTATPGGGSTFWFEVDLAAGEGGLLACGPQCPSEWKQALAGRRVLLVEDAPESRTVTAAVLGQLGLRVDLAADGAQAVAAAAATRYDAILMDIGLPVLDGFEAARRIRQREHADDEVPIIALTAQVTDGIFEQCLDAGIDDYLPKPVTRDSMVGALWRWLEPAAAGAGGAG
jgi:signal transduction histidine kinase/ActR/RegA family two-component response regulator